MATAAMGLLLGFLLVGCGGNKPCPVGEDMVESAQAQARNAAQEAQQTAGRQQELESQIQQKRQRIRELEERKAQIETELNELLGR